jgi:hypothetical protein
VLLPFNEKATRRWLVVLNFVFCFSHHARWRAMSAITAVLCRPQVASREIFSGFLFLELIANG